MLARADSSGDGCRSSYFWICYSFFNSYFLVRLITFSEFLAVL
jgi:hypothetical protein